MSDPKKFVAELQLSFDGNRFQGYEPHDTIRLAMESGDEEKPDAYVVNKSLVSFVANVNSQNRIDVLNSTLLAQLAANKQYPDEKHITEWFQTFADVLSRVGWNIAGTDFTEVVTSADLFEIESVILDILGAAIGGNAITIVMKTIEAFKKLSNSDSRLAVFEKNTHSSDKGAFLIGAADETNGVVSLTIAGFIISSEEKIKRILFFKSAKQKSKIKASTRTATLNTGIYDLVRNDILKKLGLSVNEFIAGLEI